MPLREKSIEAQFGFRCEERRTKDGLEVVFNSHKELHGVYRTLLGVEFP